MIFLVSLALLGLSSVATLGDIESTEKSLTRKLIETYENFGHIGRPIANHTGNLEVKVGLTIQQFLDVDETKQLLITNGYLTMGWTDELLRWNPEEYGNMKFLQVEIKTIWIPDIKLLNLADTRLNIYRDNRATVFSDGSVSWLPQSVFKSRCTIDLYVFPFDSQECYLDFGSISYDKDKIKLDFEAHQGVSLCEYSQSPEWTINSTEYVPAGQVLTREQNVNGERKIFYYIRFFVQLTRNSSFFVFTLIVPSLMMTMLTVVTFWLPPESPAKMIFGINNFVAFFFLLMVLNNMTPSDIKEVPLIAKYFCLNMIMLIFSSILSAVVTHLYFRNHINGRPPKFVRWMILDKIGRLVFIRQFVPSLDEVIEEAKEAKKNNPTIDYERPTITGFPDGSNRPCLHSYDEDSPVLLTKSSDFECNIKEIKRILHVLLDKKKEAKRKNIVGVEWRTTALILDRCFFLCHVLTVVLSVIAYIPSMRQSIDFGAARDVVKSFCEK